MDRTPRSPRLTGARARAGAIALVLVLVLSAGHPPAGLAAAQGRIQGRIVATDSGEPLAFADISLIPADTTMSRVGGLTNADGTFLIEAAPGRYTLQIRALSYARKLVEGVVLEEGKLVPFSTGLEPEAIQQVEIVVEGKLRENTETSMLAARKKAAAVGDAVSAEQVRKSPDKNAAEVLRRVTGLTVSDGKYVFVRGLGERYSSTEVDGVRIASPEQNKRVVPLDLFPAGLLENIVVQKTYTADRPGEFGGGDVQVHTKDFPGSRTWSVSVSQGAADNVTFKDRRADPGADVLGFGADARRIPDAVYQLAGNRKLDESTMPRSTLSAIAKSFSDVWSPRSARTAPNGNYSLSYGDEFKLFARPLGLIESWGYSRSFDQRNESQNLYRSASYDWLYRYSVSRSTASAQLGGISGLSYRLSPRHSLHLRGLYTNNADDEVRVYEGPDHTRDDGQGGDLIHRGTRLMYIQRNVLSGTLEGHDELSRFLDAQLDWKLTRSRAMRLQPDRREVIYDQRYDFGDPAPHWEIGSQGSREFGDLRDHGAGTTIGAAIPYRLGGLGGGKVQLGYDRQTKKRDNFYRRFVINHTSDPNLFRAPPDTLFGPGTYDGSDGGYATEQTYTDSRYTDNYRATQRVNAGFLSVDVPFGRRGRGTFGVRLERGFQDVQSIDPFSRDSVVQEGRLDNTDWLPSANLTCALSEAINLRLAASRTLSRPDLNELSPSPSIEYEGGALVLGNTELKRARIDNYDVRLEAFPGLSEVLAAGFFYKRLHQPIELLIKGSADPLVKPVNSDDGHNLGVEIEARSRLDRIWKRLNHLSVNANGSIISSEVELQQLSHSGSERHPLHGQAKYVVNGALSYASPNGGAEMSVLVSAVGKRLVALGFAPLPDIYEQPFTSLDATMGLSAFRNLRVKLAARNLLDPRIQQRQGDREVSGFRYGRSYSIAFSFGS